MLAQRADEIGRERLALVHVAAHGADPGRLLGGGQFRRRGLDVAAVVVVGHGLVVAEELGLRDLGDEEPVAALVVAFNDAAGEHGVGIAVDVIQAVVAAGAVRPVCELVHIRAGLEAEVLEEGKRHFLRQQREVEHAGALDHAAGVVGLDDRNGDALGLVGHLDGGVDDAGIVLVPFAGGEREQPVLELEERGRVLLALVHNRARLRHGGHKRVRNLGERSELVVLERGFDGKRLVEDVHILELGEDAAHELAGRRCPGAVFDQGDRAVLEVVRRDVEQRRLHVAEDAGVVRRGREHEVAAAEGLGYNVARVRDGDVVHGDVAHAAPGEHGGEHLRRVFRVAINRGVGDEHAALLLGRVGAPLAVLIHKPADVLAPDGAVQRADHADVERGGLLEQGLHLRAVLADDVRIVAAGIRQPVVLKVVLIGIEIAAQRAERAEGVGGKECAGRGIKADHDLRPVDHRRHDIGKRVLAEAVCIALGHEDGAGINVEGKVVADHIADLRVADDFRLGIAAHGLLKRLGVVGLHVVHDDVVQRTIAEDISKVFKELAGDGLVHRVEQDGLLVEQDIGVVRHAARDGIHALKQGQTAVGRADPIQILVHFHSAVHTCLLLLIHNSPAQPRSLSSSSFGVTPTFTAAA